MLPPRDVVADLSDRRDPALLSKRIDIPVPSGQERPDPWHEASKYALGWVYFSVVLLILTFVIRLYHIWGDKIRTALHKEDVLNSSKTFSPVSGLELMSPASSHTSRLFFPAEGSAEQTQCRKESYVSRIRWLDYLIAFSRWIFYRPVPVLRIGKLEIVPPSLAAVAIVSAALAFVLLYCFIPQPYFYNSIREGSPPLAIRAGMLAVSILPWIVALSTKSNLVTFITGIGHERLNVLHRWGGYLCLALTVIHVVPFYITPVWENGALPLYRQFIKGDFYIYGSGVAALVSLGFLCIHSLPFLRARLYELFVALHFPVAVVFVGTMFWHCNNFLTSWYYLYSTVAIWVLTAIIRLGNLNWMYPFRPSWLIGEESAVTILPENAVKVTIPTQMRWRPGQYVYLRMPRISVLGNHPFTIASLCSDDFPSSYGEEYRDMTLVFRPFEGFTKKVLHTALTKGPLKTYRSFIDGPYGGMRRDMASFDTVIFFAGGSGITAIASQLLDLIRRMRDGKALTRTVRVVWSVKRPETMDWFRQELRICRQYAPPGSFFCQFYITAAKRYDPSEPIPRPHSGLITDKITGIVQGVASKRSSAYIREAAEGDEEREKELRRENEDAISPLPAAHISPHLSGHVWNKRPLPSIDAHSNNNYNYNNYSPDFHFRNHAANSALNFGFPSTPTTFEKSLMRFAFLPSQHSDGWRTEYGRPDIPFMLREFSKDFGRRTCVFVCGPPSMRVDVAHTVAKLQWLVMRDADKDELFLHAENYAI
ncbi:hypothetical protein VTO42DRAFT_8396 [Malbranchea cinnamomea]